MPSVYTIEGPRRRNGRRRRSRRKQSPAQKRARARFKAAAKTCKRLARSEGLDYQDCMRDELGNR